MKCPKIISSYVQRTLHESIGSVGVLFTWKTRTLSGVNSSAMDPASTKWASFTRRASARYKRVSDYSVSISSISKKIGTPTALRVYLNFQPCHCGSKTRIQPRYNPNGIPGASHLKSEMENGLGQCPPTPFVHAASATPRGRGVALRFKASFRVF